MSGPQSWNEMKSGIARRKEVVRKRNQQIKHLKSRIKFLEDSHISWITTKKAFEDMADKYLQRAVAARSVAIMLMTELTEDGNDMTGAQIDAEVDRQINLTMEVFKDKSKVVEL